MWFFIWTRIGPLLGSLKRIFQAIGRVSFLQAPFPASQVPSCPHSQPHRGGPFLSTCFGRGHGKKNPQRLADRSCKDPIEGLGCC